MLMKMEHEKNQLDSRRDGSCGFVALTQILVLRMTIYKETWQFVYYT